jgi:LAO/AO transport system kinase
MRPHRDHHQEVPLDWARDLAERVIASERVAVARAITSVESADPRAHELLDALHRHLGTGVRLGITGPPGAGKSTLVGALTRVARASRQRVGIIAVDPTSPFTGGALLGDRVRMGEWALDPAVFIRSMATRGSMGGLARASEEAADILEAAGSERILIETVGVGQSEIDVVHAADTTLVVLVPESGDGVQTMKAGLMEIADIFVVNKADRAGADTLIADIETTLTLRAEAADWRPPVVRSVATSPDGVRDLWEAIQRHEQYLRESGRFAARRRERLAARMRQRIRERVVNELWHARGVEDAVRAAVAEVEARLAGPYRAADAIADRVLAGGAASARAEAVAPSEGGR